jgi:hypothetical protein
MNNASWLRQARHSDRPPLLTELSGESGSEL